MKTKSLSFKIMILSVAVMVVALILSFPKVSDTVGGWVGVAGNKINSVARTVFGVALGVFLISSGVAALAVPVVGIALIVIGLVLVAYSLWPLFKKSTASE